MEILKTFERKVLSGVLAFGLGSAALVGCGSGGPEIYQDREATVLEHEYHAPYTTYVMAGKVLVPIYHGEEHHLDVRQCDRSEDEHADAEGCVTGQPRDLPKLRRRLNHCL